MQITELCISGAYMIRTTAHHDERGHLTETFRRDIIHAETGVNFITAQVNTSVSHTSVIRGIHLVTGPVSQRKHITCVSGSVIDVVVDTRVDSPTFGEWDFVKLAHAQTSVLLDQHLGHAFIALEPSTLVYLTDAPYAPQHELTINPLDSDIGIDWKLLNATQLLSERDRSAPSLSEVAATGLLPRITRKD